MSNFRGHRLFAGRLFAGRLWGPPAVAGGVPPIWTQGGHATGNKRRRVAPGKRRRDTDDDVLLFLLR